MYHGTCSILTHPHNMQYLLLFHGLSGYTNAPFITYIACLRCLAVSVAVRRSPRADPRNNRTRDVCSCACFTLKPVTQRGMCQLYTLLLASSVL